MLGNLTDEDGKMTQACVQELAGFVKSQFHDHPRHNIANALLILGMEQAIYCGASAEECASLVTFLHGTLAQAILRGAALASLETGPTVQ